MPLSRTLTQAAVIAALAALGAQPIASAQTRSEEPPRATTPPASEPGAGRSVRQTVDDATITTRVKAALVRDDQIKARNINVDTTRGVVQLKGKVASQAEAEKAVSLARQVEGVARVENNLSVGSG